MIATLCRRIQKWRREAAKQIAKAVLVKLREYMVKLIALLLLSGLIIIAINYIPTEWQSRLVVTLKKVGVPGWLVPADPKGFTYSVEIGDAGFGYVTNLF